MSTFAERTLKYSRIYLLFLLPAIGGLLFGYAISISGGALGPKKESDGHPQIRLLYNLTVFQEETFTSINLLGALAGSLVVFVVGDRIGRKGAMMISGVLIAIGSTIVLITPKPDFDAFNPILVMFLGQLVYGVGVGFAMHSAPLYIAEISPPEIRGFLVAMKEEVIVLGILMGYVVAVSVQDLDNGWRIMFALPIAFALSMTIGFLFAPESPRVLILQSLTAEFAPVRNDEERALMSGDQDDVSPRAKEILISLRAGSTPEQVNKEMEEIKSSIKSSKAATFTDVFKGATWPALQIGVALVVFQQVTGQPSVLAYAPQVFQSAGFGSKAILAAVGVGIVKFIATLFAVLTTDKFGRIPLLLAGITGMLVSLGLLSLSFFVCATDVKGEYDFKTKANGAWGYVTLISLMIYVSSYQVGFGPITWLLQSEIFPLQTRSKAQSVAVLMNFFSNLVVGWSFLSLSRGLTSQGAYLLYASFCVVSILYVVYRVPETKGKSLEDIQKLFEQKSLNSSTKTVE